MAGSAPLLGFWPDMPARKSDDLLGQGRTVSDPLEWTARSQLSSLLDS